MKKQKKKGADSGHIGRTNPSHNTKDARERIAKNFAPVFKRSPLNYSFNDTHHSVDHDRKSGSGLMLWLFNKKNKKFSIPCQVWIRPSGKEMIGLYPRLNLPVGIENVSDAIDWATKINLYHATVTLDRMGHPRLFWIARYDDTPKELWKADSRLGKRIDRIFPRSSVVWEGKFHDVGHKFCNLLDRIQTILDYEYAREEGNK